MGFAASANWLGRVRCAACEFDLLANLKKKGGDPMWDRGVIGLSGHAVQGYAGGAGKT